MEIQEKLETDGVSIVLGSYNRKKFLKLTIESIRQEIKHCSFPTEIIVIDGGSEDGTLNWLMKQKDIITIVQHNRGTWRGHPIKRKSWGYFMNLGFKCAKGKFVCMLSDDCLVVPGALRNGYNLFYALLEQGQKIGAIAFYWREWPYKQKYMVSVTGNGKMFVNHGMFLKAILEKVHYIDENNYQFYQADSDLCLRIWKEGYSIIESPDSYIEHYSHANEMVRNSNYQTLNADKDFFFKKWKDYLNFNSSSDAEMWIWLEKEYHDPSNMVKKFQFLHLFNIKLYLIKIRRKVKKIMNNG